MAFSADIVLADSVPVNHTFTTFSVEKDGVVRVDAASTSMVEPLLMSIKHQLIGNDKTPGGASDRHLVSFIHKKKNSNGVVVTNTCNFTLTLVRDNTFTIAQVNDLWWYMKNFLNTNNIDKLRLNQS